MNSLIKIWHAAGEICGAPKGEFSKPSSYLSFYEKNFTNRRNDVLKIVEIGVYRGQFLETLAQYFPNSSIFGIDQLPNRVKTKSPNITLLKGDQEDRQGFKNIFEDHIGSGVDIIIDDASHVAKLTKTSFDSTFPYLKSGCDYYIEDWATGYWPDWPDGRAFSTPMFSEMGSDGFPTRMTSHDFGMVGLIKSLVDHVGAPEKLQVTGLSSLQIIPGIAKLTKL